MKIFSYFYFDEHIFLLTSKEISTKYLGTGTGFVVDDDAAKVLCSVMASLD